MKEVYITGAVRTAIGSFGGALRDTKAVQLGAMVIAEALRRAGLNSDAPDEVIMGHVLTAGLGQSTGRQSAILAGVPMHKPAYTVNNVCGSGLRSVMIGASSIRAQEGSIYVVGGMENMSQAPFIHRGNRFDKRFGHQMLEDCILQDALTDAFHSIHMGATAENLVKEFRISRKDQDAFALLSQEKAKKAIDKGNFIKEIMKVSIFEKGKEIYFDKDEHPRPETSYEKLARLKPAFLENGSVTPGNSSGINDGAAAMVLLSKEALEIHNIRSQAKIVDYIAVGYDPLSMGIAPAIAIEKLLQRNRLSLSDIDLIELNEAFAAQAIAVGEKINWDISKVNVHGGAIALGHPVGASGARILVTLVHALETRGKELGIAAICIGGGMGIAMLIQNTTSRP